MKILSYSYKDIGSLGWEIGPIEFRNCNLIVGVSTAGKTRILNTIYNLSHQFLGLLKIGLGKWTLNLQIGSDIWEIDAEAQVSPNQNTVAIFKHEIIRKNGEVIVNRNLDHFVLLGQTLPKLDHSKSAIDLLRDDPSLSTLYNSFLSILRRNFFNDELQNQTNAVLQINPVKSEHIKLNILSAQKTIVQRLHELKQFKPTSFNETLRCFKEVFPKVTKIEVEKVNTIEIPVITCVIYESNQKFTLQEASSGMQKVLLLILDLVSLEANSIYIVDEIENSLGSNIIGSLMDLVYELGNNKQIFMTSHNPKIINEHSLADLMLVQRNGTKINPIYGSQIIEESGNSKFDSFTIIERYMRD